MAARLNGGGENDIEKGFEAFENEIAENIPAGSSPSRIPAFPAASPIPRKAAWR
jgi:hypothetical protein